MNFIIVTQIIIYPAISVGNCFFAAVNIENNYQDSLSMGNAGVVSDSPQHSQDVFLD